MAVDIDDVFRRGGKGLIDLLEYCVVSVQLDPVFVFLAGEYRAQPSARKALALYDAFCAPGAPARVSARHALPPYDLRLSSAIIPVRENVERASRQIEEDTEETEQDSEAEPRTPLLIPARYLFDDVTQRLRAGHVSQFGRVSERYDSALTPYENLPGGRMTPGQKAFVDRVWVPRVRPSLVAVGFRRVADVA